MLTNHRILGTIGMMSGIMSVPTPFTKAWGRMLLYSQQALCREGEYIHPADTSLSLHDSARNELCRTMKGDWIVMFDCDTSFEPDIAARLVATAYRWDVDVLSAIYAFKSAPHFPILWHFNEENGKHEVIKIPTTATSEIFKVDAAGAGCLFIRKRLLERIEKQFRRGPFDRIEWRGEDFSFFHRLRDMGVPAYVAWRIEMKHLNYQEIRWSEHWREQEEAIPTAHEFEVEARRRPA